MKELYALRCFVVVAEERHMTRAAQRLHMAQPNLTRLMRRLEEEIGCLLFDHSSKQHLALTSAGEAFLQEVIPVLALYDHAIQVARQMGRGEPRKLVVGYTAAAIFSVLPAILQELERHSQEEIIIRDVSTTAHKSLIRALHEGHLDIVLTLGIDEVAGIAGECVSQAPLRVVLPVDHSLAKQEAIPLAAISREPWVWLPRHLYPRFYDDVMALCQQAGFHPRIEHVASQAQAIVSMVAARAGIAIVTQWAEQSLSQQGVVYRPLLDVSYQAELHMLWRAQEVSPFVHSFLRVARAIQ